MLNGLGRHVGAAEGTITIGDHLDVDGAAICILWVPEEQEGHRSPSAPSAGSGRLCTSLFPNQYLHTHSKVQLLMSDRGASVAAKRLGMKSPVWPASNLMFSLCVSSQGEVKSMFLKSTNKLFKEQLSPQSFKTFRGQWTLIC